MSTLETMVLPCIISQFRDSTFVVKQSLVDYPVFKHIMRSRDPITVGRTNPRDDLKAVFEGGEARLRAGRSIVIFPQTTGPGCSTRAVQHHRDQAGKTGRRAGRSVALKTDAWATGST